MTKNNTILIVALVLIVSVSSYFAYFKNKTKEINNSPVSYKDATYTIEGQKVTLKNGYSSVPVAPGSATTVTTSYFGNEVSGDFNSDGKPDIAFLLTQNSGGSGTFYYVVAAVNSDQGYIGSDAVLLGDRISPQTTELNKNNVIVVNYADRKPGESFAVQPSVGKSIWLKLDINSMQFGVVAQNFEGEADPSKMTLGMKTWNWLRTELNDGTTVTPKVLGKFKLTFKDGKVFSATTDCNGVGGEYGIKGNSITFSKMMSTLMACEGSQEAVFSSYLQNTSSYLFSSKGELILNLKYDSGSVIFN